MRTNFSLATAVLLLGALMAPTSTADESAPPVAELPCSTRLMVVAVESAILAEGYTCQPDEAVWATSQAATSATWLYGATPETVCTELLWTHDAAHEWFGAPCGSVAGASDASTAAPCGNLDLEGQSARDLCGFGNDAPAFSPPAQSNICIEDKNGDCIPIPECNLAASTGTESTSSAIDPCNPCPDQSCIPDICELLSPQANVAPESSADTTCLDVGSCPPGSVGAVVNGRSACVPTPQLCDPPSYGIKPNCVTVTVTPCPSGQVGYKVNGVGYCATVQPCPSGSYGVNGNCHTVQPCPSGQYGYKVDGTTGYCASVQPCPSGSYGANGNCHTVQPCPSGQYGYKVDGTTGYCATAQLCPAGSYGINGNCHTIEPCGSGQVGYKVDGTTGYCTPVPTLCPSGSYGLQPNCHTVATCASGTYGVRVDSTSVCQPIPTVPDDQDADGAKDQAEITGGSNPKDADSQPTTDDDGDGTTNTAEPGGSYARGDCTGSYGLVYAATCNGYTNPGGNTAGLVAQDSAKRVWVWDSICTPGAQGNYAPCKNGNYAGTATLYTGTFSGDGYGWRYVANVPALGPTPVNVVLPCADFTDDADGDGFNVYRFCNAVLTIYPNGSTTTQETGFRTQVGDPNDNDPNSPAPDAGVEEGPYSTVQRSTGDGVYYKVGAVVTVAGVPVDLVQEDTVDAGLLPRTFSVPSGAPTYGPDADGDGLPAYADVPTTAWTIQDSATLTTTTAPGNPMRFPLDNNDNQPAIPSGPGPVSNTVPTWMQPGPDNDADGVPATIVVEYSTITVGGPETVSIVRAPSQDTTLAADPNDNDPNNPRPSAGGEVPVDVPGGGQSVPVPGTSTPNVPGRDQDTPPVVLPATCTMNQCTTPTTILGAQNVPVPGLPGTGVPSSAEICDDAPALCDGQDRICAPLGLICLGPFSETPITEPVPGTTVPTPPVKAPAICVAAPQVCLPPTTVVPGGTQHVPGAGPVSVTPPIVVSVAWTGLDGYVDPNAGEFTTIGPFPVQVGPVPITLCANTCPLPVPAAAHGTGSVTVMVAVGTQTFTQNVPIAF